MGNGMEDSLIPDHISLVFPTVHLTTSDHIFVSSSVVGS